MVFGIYFGLCNNVNIIEKYRQKHHDNGAKYFVQQILNHKNKSFDKTMF